MKVSVVKMGNIEQLSNYGGSRALTFLSDYSSLSIDKVNFISCQLFALFLSYVLRKCVSDPKKKQLYCLVCGVFLCYFCFGNEMFHVAFSAAIAWILMQCVKSSFMPWIVLTVTMVHLSILHLKRQFMDGTSYSIDITAPVMVITQRVTALAFSLQDGIDQSKSPGVLKSDLHRQYVITRMPTALEYWSYALQFQSMLAGPLVMYGDYMDFIRTKEFPSPNAEVFRKIIASVTFAIIYIKMGSVFPISRIKEDEFLYETTIFYKFYYIILTTTLERTKYYHAWILADAVCNASGLGYDQTKQTWDLVTNVKPMGVELGNNLKASLDEWNKGTMKWLRHVVYDRCPNSSLRTFLTYGLSSFWHGFYPGYYLTFFAGALFTSAARVVRRCIRPLFVESRVSKMFYDCLTFVVTRLVLAYATFSFVILDFMPSIMLTAKLYFCFHLAAIGAIIALPTATQSLRRSYATKEATKTKSDEEVI